MSVDAVAVLRISHLAEPPTPLGTNHPVEHRGDASLVNLMQRFDGADPDEHALSLRRLLGPALDAHDDPHGILFFADVTYPKATTYDALVREVSTDGGVWAPKVAADYVPLRYRGKPRKSHDALVGEMIAVMGRDAALELDMLAQVNSALLANAPDRHDAAEAYRARLEAVTSAMGREFAQRYGASLQTEVDAMRSSQGRNPVRLDRDSDPESDIPQAYPSASPNSHEALVAEMIEVMGREAALQASMMASMGSIIALTSPGLAGASGPRRAALDAIRRAMGSKFADRYEASLERLAEALRAQTESAMADWKPPPDWLKQE